MNPSKCEEQRGRLTYRKNGRPCLLINGTEIFGAVAERLCAYEDSGYTIEELQKLREAQLWADAFAPRLTRERYEQICMAEIKGRLFILPPASEQDKQNVLDLYRDARHEWIHDPSVGLYGPNENEVALMDAIESALASGRSTT